MNKIFFALLGLIAFAYVGYHFYLMPKFSNGAEVPEFEATLLNGLDFSLSDLQGNYVLLDFWGSWCGPCRKDNPKLVSLYKELNGKKYQKAEGFEIVSIAIETSEKSWKRAIERDGLAWPHHIVQTDRFKSPIPMLYGVREIPTKYLLDGFGKIIAVNPNNDRVKELIGDPKD